MKENLRYRAFVWWTDKQGFHKWDGPWQESYWLAFGEAQNKIDSLYDSYKDRGEEDEISELLGHVQATDRH